MFDNTTSRITSKLVNSCLSSNATTLHEKEVSMIYMYSLIDHSLFIRFTGEVDKDYVIINQTAPPMYTMKHCDLAIVVTQQQS